MLVLEKGLSEVFSYFFKLEDKKNYVFPGLSLLGFWTNEALQQLAKSKQMADSVCSRRSLRNVINFLSLHYVALCQGTPI